MAYSETRADYLRQKYGPHDDEQDGRYSKKKSKSRPKKADHKHNYRNCVLKEEVETYDAANPMGKGHRTEYYLGSVCSICGKIGDFNHQKDQYHRWWDEAHKPHYWSMHSFSDDYKAMIEKYKKVLPIYEVPGGFGTKYALFDGAFFPKPDVVAKEIESGNATEDGSWSSYS